MRLNNKRQLRTHARTTESDEVLSRWLAMTGTI